MCGPRYSDELAYARPARGAQEELIALGITGWQDAMVGAVGGIADPLGAYRRAIGEGTLQVHVVGAQWWERDGGIEQVERMTARRDELAARRFPPNGSRSRRRRSWSTASPRTRPRRCSRPTATPTATTTAQQRPLVRRPGAAARGRHGARCRGHAGALPRARRPGGARGARRGRGGARRQRCRPTAGTTSRTCRSSTRPTSPRFADARRRRQHPGAVGDARGPARRADAAVPARRRRGRGTIRSATSCVARARLAAGSDWPVSSADPMDAIHIAVNRIATRQPRHAPLGGDDQRIDLATAMAAYTSGTAYVNHREHDTGCIREGYLANLVVLSTPTPSPSPPRRSTVRPWCPPGSRAPRVHSAPPTPSEEDMHDPSAAPVRARASPPPRPPPAIAARRSAGARHPAPRARRRRVGARRDDRCTLRRHRLVHLGELRRALLARLRLRVRLRRQPGARERVRVAAAAEPGLHALARVSPSRSRIRPRRHGSTRSATA